MTLSGPKAYTTEEVIALCEEYGNAEADVSPQKCMTCCSCEPLVAVPSLLPHWRKLLSLADSLCAGSMPAYCLMLQRLPLQVTRVPVWLLKSTRNILSAFQWARDAADRLVR